MMDVFNVTLLEELGYKETQDFWDPMDPRFAPRASKASDYEESSVRSTLRALGSLGAYKNAAAVAQAESEYYATAGYPTESGSPAPATGSPAPASAQPTVTGSQHGGRPTGRPPPGNGRRWAA